MQPGAWQYPPPIPGGQVLMQPGAYQYPAPGPQGHFQQQYAPSPWWPQAIPQPLQPGQPPPPGWPAPSHQPPPAASPPPAPAPPAEPCCCCCRRGCAACLSIAVHFLDSVLCVSGTITIFTLLYPRYWKSGLLRARVSLGFASDIGFPITVSWLNRNQSPNCQCALRGIAILFGLCYFAASMCSWLLLAFYNGGDLLAWIPVFQAWAFVQIIVALCSCWAVAGRAQPQSPAQQHAPPYQYQYPEKPNPEDTPAV